MRKLRNNYILVWLWSLGVFLLALRPIESFDTFWQLQSGKYIWQTGQFIYQDTFSLAADVFRLEHTWLHDIILYLFYSAGGYQLLSLLKPAIIALCGYLLLLRSIRLSVDPVVAVLVLLVSVIGSEPSWLVRPQLWTFLFPILYLLILFSGRDRGWRRWLWLIPIMLFWANLHAGSVFGFVLIGLFATGELWRVFTNKQQWQRFFELVVVGGLTFAIAFLNPYGYKIPLGQLLAHLNQHKVLTGDAPIGMMGNMEWLPPSFEQVPLFYLIMVVWGLLILLRFRKLDPAEGIFFLAFLYMGVSQIRHTTLVALLAGFFLPLAFKEFLESIKSSRNRSFPVVRGVVILGLIATSVYFIMPFANRPWGWGLKETEYPVGAANFVASNSLPGNLYNSYDWGGYLMWQLYPKYLVFVDGRSTSARFFRQSSVIDAADAGWRGYLDENSVNTIITRTSFYDTGEPVSLVFSLAKDKDWTLTFADGVSLVFVRTELLPERVTPLEKSLAFESMYQEASRLLEEDSQRTRAPVSMALAAWKLGRQQQAVQIYEEQIKGKILEQDFKRYMGKAQ
jgi:hypothetical protein